MNETYVLERFNRIIKSEHAVLFMKGTPSFPVCGLSGSICFMLKKNNFAFRYINILIDPELHTFLKELHSKDEIPHLFVDEKFVGGYYELQSVFSSGAIYSLI